MTGNLAIPEATHLRMIVQNDQARTKKDYEALEKWEWHFRECTIAPLTELKHAPSMRWLAQTGSAHELNCSRSQTLRNASESSYFDKIGNLYPCARYRFSQKNLAVAAAKE